MGTMMVNALYAVLQAIVNGTCAVLGYVLTYISQDYAIAMTQQSWVTDCVQVSTTVAAAFFTVYVAWIGVSKYILWNEGTGDTDGGQVWKGVLRVAIFGAASTWLVANVYQIGIWYGGALMASPISVVLSSTQGLLNQASAIAGMTIETLLVIILGIVFLLICIVIVSIQAAIRAAELIYYMVAAPIVSLGQINSDGGIWNNWWRSLVVLSFSGAVQWLGIKIVIASFTLITLVPAAAGGPITGICVSLVLALGAAIATISGPHLLKEWSYHTGVGGGLTTAGMFVMQTVARERIRTTAGPDR